MRLLTTDNGKTGFPGFPTHPLNLIMIISPSSSSNLVQALPIFKHPLNTSIASLVSITLLTLSSTQPNSNLLPINPSSIFHVFIHSSICPSYSSISSIALLSKYIEHRSFHKNQTIIISLSRLLSKPLSQSLYQHLWFTTINLCANRARPFEHQRGLITQLPLCDNLTY